jgi:hypothetical protein
VPKTVGHNRHRAIQKLIPERGNVEVLTRATTDSKSTAFLAVTLYRQIGVHRRFEGMTGHYVTPKRQ